MLFCLFADWCICKSIRVISLGIECLVAKREEVFHNLKKDTMFTEVKFVVKAEITRDFRHEIMDMERNKNMSSCHGC